MKLADIDLRFIRKEAISTTWECRLAAGTDVEDAPRVSEYLFKITSEGDSTKHQISSVDKNIIMGEDAI